MGQKDDKTGKNQELYSKNGIVQQYFDFQKETVKQTQEGYLLLKRTKKGTGEGARHGGMVLRKKDPRTP